MNIGEKIKQRRKELNMSADDLALALNKNRATIFRYEKGDIEKMSVTILPTLAKVLNVSIGYLLGLEEKELNDADIKAQTRSSLGKKIKKARKAKGLTQEELGNLLGIQKSAVAKYENGRIVNLKQETLKKLSEILGLSIDELILDDDDNDDGKETAPLSDDSQSDRKNDNDTELPNNSKKEVLDIILRLHNDNEFFTLVEQISKLDIAQLSALKQMLSVFNK